MRWIGLHRTRCAPAAMAALLLVLAASPGRVAAQQFQINEYTTGRQFRPSLSADAAGNFVVVWESDSSTGTDSSSYSIQARRFAANGTPLGDQFQVNDYTTGAQSGPWVATDASGAFVVAWQSDGSPESDSDHFSIQARSFDSDGSPLGGQFQVNDYTTEGQYQPTVATDAAGSFVVVWNSYGSPGDDATSSSIQARRFGSNGAPLGGQFQVNDYTMSSSRLARVVTGAGGGFIVVWVSNGSHGSDSNDESIQARRFDSNGAALASQFQVNEYTTGFQYWPSVATDAAGNFVVAWASEVSPGSDSSPDSVQARLFASDATPLGGEFQVNEYTTSDQDEPLVARGEEGDFVVTWDSYGSSGSDSSDLSIQARRFDKSGVALGGEFQVNDYTTGGQILPSVASDGRGAFVVAWGSDGSPGSDSDGYSIQATVIPEPGPALFGLAALAALGCLARRRLAVAALLLAAMSPEHAAAQQFQVNDYTTGRQTSTSVATDASGNFVVVWGQDSGAEGIQARRFAASGTPLGGQFQVNDYTTGSQYQPSVAMAADGRFVVVWASYGSPGNDSDYSNIQARRFGSDGTPLGGQFQVNDYTTGHQAVPSVASDPSGNFVIAWSSGGSPENDSDGTSIQARRFGSNGAPSAVQFQVNDYTTNSQVVPKVASDASGNFVVAWESYGSPGDDSSYESIQARRFASSGVPFAGQFQVNNYTTQGQYFPSVASDASGDFVVAWDSYGSPGDDSSLYSVQARRFGSDGTPLGQQFQVNDYTTLTQSGASVATESNGGFVVSWESDGSPGNDSSSYSIQARHFDSNGAPLAVQFQVNDYTTDNQAAPAVARDGTGRLVFAWTSFGSPGSDSDSYSIQATVTPEPESSLLGLAALAALACVARRSVVLR